MVIVQLVEQVEMVEVELELVEYQQQELQVMEQIILVVAVEQLHQEEEDLLHQVW